MNIIFYFLNIHPYYFWGDPFFYLFIFILVVWGISIYFLKRKIISKSVEFKQFQQQYTAKIDLIRKEHAKKLDSIRSDMIKKEEERTRQWIESEKETLHVLNGVSSLLELSESIGQAKSEKIISKLEEIRTIVTKKSQKDE